MPDRFSSVTGNVSLLALLLLMFLVRVSSHWWCSTNATQYLRIPIPAGACGYGFSLYMWLVLSLNKNKVVVWLPQWNTCRIVCVVVLLFGKSTNWCQRVLCNMIKRPALTIKNNKCICMLRFEPCNWSGRHHRQCVGAHGGTVCKHTTLVSKNPPQEVIKSKTDWQ